VLADCGWRMMNSQPTLHLLGTGCSGWMRVGPKGVKEPANVITGPLFIIFQQSWESGEVPVDCKLANVPISKQVSQSWDLCKPTGLSSASDRCLG